MKFPHIQVMSASAGAGKTRALSERYLEFLLSPEIKTSARNILAITFTNKAAGEMKKRIISGLKQIALGGSERKEAAERVLEELLDRYSDLKIQTIDSFLTSITISSALELGLPPDFEIVLDSSPALGFVLDELLAQVYPDSDGKQGKITRHFLDLLNELLQIGQGPGWDIKRTILDNIRNLRNQEFLSGRRLKKTFSSKDIREKRELVKKRLGEFLEMVDKLNLNLNFIRAANRFIEERDYWPWESKYLLKEDVGELVKKGSTLTAAHKEVWREIRKEFSSLAEISAHCRFAPFINIITLFDEGLQSYKRRVQAIFIEDLNPLLGSFLSRKGIVPEIYFHLGDRILHFFIDEFQDTSLLQWQNLFPLIEEALSKRGSLFYVGDKKQAIYGFRGGESRLFDEAKNNFLSVEKESIKEEFSQINYRSRANIVEFINQIFSSDNLISWIELEVKNQEGVNFDPSLLLKTYTHAKQVVPQREESKGGFVRVERISANLERQDLDAEIGRRLVSLIQNDLIHRYSYGDIAILVRTNIDVSLVTEILTAADIPVASEKTLSICSNHLIQEIVSFLKFLDSPIDNFAFACFVSGEVFLKSLETDSLTRFTPEVIYSFLLENRKSQRPLYTIFRERFPNVWDKYIEEYFNAVGFLPPYDLVSRIFKKYQVLQNFPDEEGFFFQLLEVLKGMEAEGKNSLKAFLDLWYGVQEKGEEFQVACPGYTDAIKVFTIHKAKGLEFPVVISPFTYIENKSISQVYEIEGSHLIPYRINQDQARASPKLGKLRSESFTSQLIDELNTFYVCLTRAEDELYIFLPDYKNKRGKFYGPILFEGTILEIGSPIERSPGIPKQKKGRIHPEMVNEWQDKLRRLPVDKNELMDTARKKAKERGVLIHNFLAQIKRLSEEWSDEIGGMLGSLDEEEKDLIQDFFNKEDLRRWFVLPDDTSVFCEREIVDQDGEVYRIDRLLVTPSTVIAIEFKSGEPRSHEHQEQVIKYLRLLSKVYPDRTLEGWLVYVDELTQEKIFYPIESPSKLLHPERKRNWG